MAAPTPVAIASQERSRRRLRAAMFEVCMVFPFGLRRCMRICRVLPFDRPEIWQGFFQFFDSRFSDIGVPEFKLFELAQSFEVL